VPKELRLAAPQVTSLQDPLDVEALTLLLGGQEAYGYTYATNFPMALRKGLTVPLAERLLPRLAEAGRLYQHEYTAGGRPPEPLGWDGGEAWRLWLDV